VVSDPTVMVATRWSGHPHLGRYILSYLRAGCSPQEIFRDYPSLPVNGIDAVSRWAEITYGPEWRSCEPSNRSVK
jgi:hypothetical protein